MWRDTGLTSLLHLQMCASWDHAEMASSTLEWQGVDKSTDEFPSIISHSNQWNRQKHTLISKNKIMRENRTKVIEFLKNITNFNEIWNTVEEFDDECESWVLTWKVWKAESNEKCDRVNWITIFKNQEGIISSFNERIFIFKARFVSSCTNIFPFFYLTLFIE